MSRLIIYQTPLVAKLDNRASPVEVGDELSLAYAENVLPRLLYKPTLVCEWSPHEDLHAILV